MARMMARRWEDLVLTTTGWASLSPGVRTVTTSRAGLNTFTQIFSVRTTGAEAAMAVTSSLSIMLIIRSITCSQLVESRGSQLFSSKSEVRGMRMLREMELNITEDGRQLVRRGRDDLHQDVGQVYIVPRPRISERDNNFSDERIDVV